MATLSKADLAFLAHHGIDISKAFDASGLNKAEYGPRMKAEGKLVAYGVRPCTREGHSLRNRHGNCLRCFPSSIRFQARAGEAGYVYLAESMSTKLIKIGFSRDQIANRIYIANLEGFGGFHDWVVKASIESQYAGRIELGTHRYLKDYAHPVLWVRNGLEIKSVEIFKCSFMVAIDALANVGFEYDMISIDSH